jgi:hypothetical protein
MYALINNQTVIKFPYSLDDLRMENPNTSFPNSISAETLAEFNVFQVSQTTPDFNELTQTAEMSGCVFNATSGQWETAWTVRAKTQQELDLDLERFKLIAIKKTNERLDSFAKTRDYDTILSACSYAGSTVQKFQIEGQYAILARDLTWSSLYQILADIENNSRSRVESFEDIEIELPVLNWPN